LLPSVLVVEDDDFTRETLSIILKAKDYDVTTAISVDHAIAVLKNKRFDVLIMATQLLGKDHVRLQSLDDFAADTIKIMITAYPSKFTNTQALALGADAYIVKPIDPEDLLKTIQTKLDERIKDMDLTIENKTWLNVSFSKIIAPAEFKKYLEHMVEQLISFGLTANQAKVYVTVVAIEPAHVSRIATVCGIRREEVYRVLPDLLKLGIVTKKLGNPVTYFAMPPVTSVELLMKLKFKKATDELNNLINKKSLLTANLKRLEVSSSEEAKSIESIQDMEKLLERLTKCTATVKNRIDVIMPLDILQFSRLNIGHVIAQLFARQVRLRLIIDEPAIKPSFAWIQSDRKRGILNLNTKLVDLRFVDKMPFHLVIIDDAEVIMGDFSVREDGSCLWTNLPYHVQLVKTAFEALWQQTTSLEEIPAKD
jgi:sugar-specific transcriptional regulator TrmB